MEGKYLQERQVARAALRKECNFEHTAAQVKPDGVQKPIKPTTQVAYNRILEE
jgi:hypothetical protein